MANTSGRDTRLLKRYAALVTVFNLVLGRKLLTKGARSPAFTELGLVDLFMLGLSTHKLSRIATKAVVTSPFRAPFTRFQEYLGYGEANEEPKAEGGFQEAVGELVSCNYCADPWIALGMLYAFDGAPARARLAMKFFSAVALADFLHVSYEKTRTHENVLTLHEEKLEREERETTRPRVRSRR
ncbi:MAG TPA: DUF1360 domain-containing protein [Bdellovibrionota bacterium]|nr:DUF1360 domain-containing protein [Bdellovibrionota bacterium]